MTAIHPVPAGRLIVVTNDLPYPPNFGHKVDQFNRWQGFAARGWRLRLICWRSPNDPPVSDADVAALRSLFEHIDILPIAHDARSLLRRLALMPRYPSHVASRWPTPSVAARLETEAHAFAPDAIVNDGIYGAALGNRLASACGVPAILRAHNVEHIYFAQQAKRAASAKARVAWSIARVGLERWERSVTQDAAWSFQISADDVRYWQDKGIERASWAPTVRIGAAHGTIIAPEQRKYDVAYIGNMRLPNNIEGLGWFVDKVLPHLIAHRPKLSLCFAGANPSTQARAIFARAPQIETLFDVPSADAILAQGRVLVNPILSGSGVNVKSIDMLRYDAPIVTTPVGVQGFPAQMHDQFVIESDAQGFAQSILAALDHGAAPTGRASARACFSEAGLDDQIRAYARAANIA